MNWTTVPDGGDDAACDEYGAAASVIITIINVSGVVSIFVCVFI